MEQLYKFFDDVKQCPMCGKNNYTIENKDNKGFILNCSKDIRENIFLFAITHKLTLIEIQLLQENLESVFKELTQ